MRFPTTVAVQSNCPIENTNSWQFLYRMVNFTAETDSDLLLRSLCVRALRSAWRSENDVKSREEEFDIILQTGA